MYAAYLHILLLLTSDLLSLTKVAYVNAFSAVECENGKQYESCGNPVQLTCENTRNYNDLHNKSIVGCVEGCFCPRGFVLQGEYFMNCTYDFILTLHST